MKKLLILTLIALTLTTSTLLTGCDCQAESKSVTPNPWKEAGLGMEVRIMKIEGHDYVLMAGSYCGGIIHAASCPCMKK